MNKEIEIKVGLKDYTAAKKSISKIAKFVKKKHQIDEYWTPKHKNIYVLKSPEYWRIRKEGKSEGKEKVRYEYHKSKINKNGKGKYTEEYETVVDDGKILNKIMGFIDAKLVVIVDKKREYYENKDFEFCLDRVEGLGDFLEIEAKRVLGTYEKTLDKCWEMLETLGVEHTGKERNYFYQMYNLDKTTKRLKKNN